MYGIYIPTFTIKFNHSWIGKYTSPMDPLGMKTLNQPSCINSEFPGCAWCTSWLDEVDSTDSGARYLTFIGWGNFFGHISLQNVASHHLQGDRHHLLSFFASVWARKPVYRAMLSYRDALQEGQTPPKAKSHPLQAPRKKMHRWEFTILAFIRFPLKTKGKREEKV